MGFQLEITHLDGPQIYLLIAIFAIGEQKSVLAKQRRMHFVTSDENAKGQGCSKT